MNNDAVLQRAQREFWCPACRRLSNIAIPYFVEDSLVQSQLFYGFARHLCSFDPFLKVTSSIPLLCSRVMDIILYNIECLEISCRKSECGFDAFCLLDSSQQRMMFHHFINGFWHFSTAFLSSHISTWIKELEVKLTESSTYSIGVLQFIIV